MLPEGLDLGAPYVAKLDLVEIDAPDGTHRFMLGVSGVFKDSLGRLWYGSTAIKNTRMRAVIGDIAPAGEISLSFVRADGADDLIEQIKALGLEYVSGRKIRFLVQLFQEGEVLERPGLAPVVVFTRTMRSLNLAMEGPLLRRLTVGYEAVTEGRREARGVTLDVAGHEAMLGETNPSLQFRPTSDSQWRTPFL